MFKSKTENPKKHSILITSINISDGIGDFQNLIDYFERVKAYCKQHNIPSKIQCVAILGTNKLSIAKLICPENIKLHIYDIEKDKVVDQGILDSSDIIIFLGKAGYYSQIPSHYALDKFFDSNDRVKKLFKNTDMLLNVATPLWLACDSYGRNNLLLKYLNTNCFVHSRLEYGPPEDDFTEPYLYDRTWHWKLPSFLAPAFIEDCMGFGKETIRLYVSIGKFNLASIFKEPLFQFFLIGFVSSCICFIIHPTKNTIQTFAIIMGLKE